MSIARRQALRRIAGLSVKVREHLAKIERSPGTRSAAHWRKEVNAWMAQIEQLSEVVGDRTSAQIRQSVEAWQRQLGAMYGADE